MSSETIGRMMDPAAKVLADPPRTPTTNGCTNR